MVKGWVLKWGTTLPLFSSPHLTTYPLFSFKLFLLNTCCSKVLWLFGFTDVFTRPPIYVPCVQFSNGGRGKPVFQTIFTFYSVRTIYGLWIILGTINGQVYILSFDFWKYWFQIGHQKWRRRQFEIWNWNIYLSSTPPSAYPHITSISSKYA